MFPGQNGVFCFVFEECEQNLFSWCRSHFQGFGVVAGPVRIAAGTGCPLSVHKIFQKRITRERKGGVGNQVPRPSPMKFASEIRTGKNARLMFFWSL